MINTKNIEFPISALKASEILKKHKRTIVMHCKKHNCIIIGNSYMIDEYMFRILEKSINEHPGRKKSQ